MPSVGELKVTLTADISELKEALRQGNSLLDSISENMKEAKGTVRSGVAEISGSISNLSIVVNGVAGAFNGVSGEVSTSMNSISNSAQQMSGNLQASMREANESLDTMNMTLGNIEGKTKAQTSAITRNFNELAKSIDVTMGIVNDDMLKGFSGVSSSLKGFGDNFSKLSRTIRADAKSMKSDLADIGEAIIGKNAKVGNLTKISNQLGAIIKQMREVQNKSMNFDAFDKTAMGNKLNIMIKTLADGFIQLERQAKRTGNSMEEAFSRANTGAGKAHKGIMATAMSLRQAALDVFILRMNIQFMADTMWGAVKQGVQFGAQMENAQLGMAGILTSMTQIDGKQTTFAEATGIAANLMSQIADKALLTTVTTGELLETFQALLAPGLSAKMTLEQIVDLATVGANAVKAIGLPSNQVVQEMRDLIMGGIRPQSSTLAASLGITDADVKRLREAGTLYDELIHRMDGFKQASEKTQDTFNGLWSNIQDGIQRSQETAFKPYFKYLKNELKSVQSLFYDINKIQVKKKGKDGNEVVEEKQIAVLNDKTAAFFSKVGNMAVRVINIFKNIFTSIAPLISPLFTTFEKLIVLLDVLMNALTPLLAVLSALLGVIVKLVNEGLSFLADNIWIVVGVLGGYFIPLMYTTIKSLAVATASTKLYSIALAICSAVTTLLTGSTAGFSKVLALISVKFMLIALAVMAVVAVLATLYYAWDETTKMVQAGLDYMHSLFAEWRNKMGQIMDEWLINFRKNLKGMQESWNESFGGKFFKFDLADDDKVINKLTDRLANYKSEEADLVAKSKENWQNFAINKDLAFRKTKDGLFKTYEDFSKKLIPDMPDVKGIPKEDEGKGGKGANKLANAQEKLDMAEIDARRKAYVEDIKKYIKERDIAYEQGEISQRDHIKFTYEAEKQIALIEYQALEEKLAVQKAKAQESRNRGAEAEALKDEADAVKIASEMRSKLVEIETKDLEYKNNLIKAQKEELKTLYDTIIAYRDITGGVAKYKSALAEIDHVDRAKKLDTIVASIKKQLQPTNELTQAKRAELEAELALAEEARKAEDSKSIYDSKINAMNEYKADYDRVMAGVEATEAENNLLVKQGKMTEMQAQEQSIQLRRNANAELQVTIDKIDELMRNSADDPVLLNQLRKLKAELQGIGTELSGIAKQLKSTLEDGITDAFTGIITGTKKVSQAFHELATSIFNDVTKYIVKGFAQNLVQGMGINNWFGGNKQPQQGATTGGRNANGTKNNVESFLNAENSLKIFSNTAKQANSVLDNGLKLGKEDNILSKAANFLTQTKNTKDMDLAMTLDMLKQSAMDASTALSSLASSSGGSTGKDGGFSFNPIGMFSNIFKASGGYIQGEGTGTSDDIPAWLSNGEFVMQASVVKKFGRGFFDRLNGGSLPVAKFASGGAVGTVSSGSSNSQTVPNIKIDIINQSGAQLDAKMGSMEFDGRQWVMQMFLSGLGSNVMGSRDILKGMR